MSDKVKQETQIVELSLSQQIVEKASKAGHLDLPPFRGHGIEEKLEVIYDSVIEPTTNIPPSLAVLWQCPKCGHYQVSKCFEATVVKNFIEGSQKAPLRARCKNPKCKRTTRLRSEEFDHVLAEVSWKRILQRDNLKRLAEELNIYRLADEKSPPRYIAYRLWNDICGHKAKGAIPMPFRRWLRRGEE